MGDGRRRILVFAGSIALAGCASKAAAPKQRVAFRTVAVVPAVGPAAFEFESQTAAQFLFPLAATAVYLDSKAKSRLFNEQLPPASLNLAARLNDVVLAHLRADGRQAVIVDKLQRDPDSPDYVDLEAVRTDADAVVHVRFEQVGFFSPRGDLALYPRLNIRSTVYVPVNKDYPYDDTTYFGYDAKPRVDWGIVADPGFVYASLEDLLARGDDVRARLAAATDATAALAMKRLQPVLSSA